MTWGVVCFAKENTVEVVPIHWYIKESNECFWPPTKTGKLKILRYIQTSTEPDVDWNVHPANLLGEYDALEVATKKAKRAEDTSDLNTTSSDDVIRGRRRVKPNPKYSRTSSSDENPSSSKENSFDDNTYPSFKSQIYKAISTPQSKTFREKTRSKSSPPAATASCTPVGTKITTPATSQVVLVERNCSTPMENRNLVTTVASDTTNLSKRMLNDSDWKNVILEEVARLHLKIDAILDTMKLFHRHTQYEYSHKTNNNEFFTNLPIKNEDTFFEMEQWLKNNENYKIAVWELSRIGGTSMSQATRKVLYRTLTNEVGNLYSWDGLKHKKCFKTTLLGQVILDSMKSCFKENTENEIIQIIKSWLVKCKERMTSKLRKELDK